MARKANRYNAVAAASDQVQAVPEKTFRAGLYARLSVEINERPSNSIQTQLDIMHGYVNSHPEIIEAFEYADSGFSGTNFERPNFNRLMDDVRAGKINCILVKDLSRFGRDYLETTNYIEIILPFLGVRFISVNDHFDTDAACNGNKTLEIALKNLVNDMYAKDVSKRVSTVRRQEVERGKFTGSNAPYGYVVDDKDPLRHFLIDEPAAAVVRDMYQMADDGMSVREISLELQRRNLSIPGQYLKTGHLYQEEGDVVYHKYEQESVGGNDKKVLDPAEWKIVKNMHEPLVSQKDFDKAQKRLQSNKKVKKVYPKHCLSGMVECGICGHNMRHANSGRPKYECAFTYFNINHKHDRNSIIDTEIEAAVLAALQKEMDLKAESGKIYAERKELQRSKADEAQRRLKDMEKSLDQLYEDQRESFESFKAGMTEKDTFLQQKQIYEQMEERLKEKIRQQKEAVEQLEDEVDAMPDGFSVDQDEIQADQLTREMTEAFVEKVIVWPGQKLDIRWKTKK